MKVGQLRVAVWPPSCWRKARSPSMRATLGCGISVTPATVAGEFFFAKQFVDRARGGVTAMNMPLASAPRSALVPPVIMTGRGAHMSTSSWSRRGACPTGGACA